MASPRAAKPRGNDHVRGTRRPRRPRLPPPAGRPARRPRPVRRPRRPPVLARQGPPAGPARPGRAGVAHRPDLRAASARAKGYLSVENVEVIAALGGEAFIAPKSNTTGAAGGLFEKMVH